MAMPYNTWDRVEGWWHAIQGLGLKGNCIQYMARGEGQLHTVQGLRWSALAYSTGDRVEGQLYTAQGLELIGNCI